jgi:hypothetical protein
MMPTALNTAASSGMVMTPAQKRGARMRCTGSTAIISMALSCSPAFMRPISAVSDVPARPCKQQRRDHRPEFAHQAERDQQAQRLGRPVPLQRVIALQPEHEADEEARHRDDRERVIAQEMDLVAHQAEAGRLCAPCSDRRRNSFAAKPMPPACCAPQSRCRQGLYQLMTGLRPWVAEIVFDSSGPDSGISRVHRAAH